MKFAQIIEFTTTRIDEFNTNLDAWMAKSEGHRIPHRAVLRSDRDTDNVYLLRDQRGCAQVPQSRCIARRGSLGVLSSPSAGLTEIGRLSRCREAVAVQMRQLLVGGF